MKEMVQTVTAIPRVDKALDRIIKSKKYRGAVQQYMKWRKEKKFGSNDYETLKKTASVTGVDFKNLNKILHKSIKRGVVPKNFALKPALQEKKTFKDIRNR